MHAQKRVADELLRRIAVAQYAVGGRLPTENELTGEFGVSRGTVRRAFRRLIESGVVELRHGVGCIVRRCDANRETEPKSVMFLYPEVMLLNSQTIEGMQRSAFAQGAEFGMMAITPDPEAVRGTVVRLKRNRTSGVVFIPFIRHDFHGLNNRLLDLFEEYELRCVVIDTPVIRRNAIRGDFVGQDDYNAMRLLVKTLARNGFRRFASIRVFPEVYSSSRRFCGTVDGLEEAGLPVYGELHRVSEDGPLPEQGRRQLREILNRPETPDVILCGYDLIAMNVLDELKKLGRRVPDEISVAGFGDTDYYSTLFELTSVRQPMAEIGRRAVEILLGRRRAVCQEFLPCEPVLRRSCRTPGGIGG